MMNKGAANGGPILQADCKGKKIMDDKKLDKNLLVCLAGRTTLQSGLLQDFSQIHAGCGCLISAFF
ncbi:MAG: hypothetical protein ABI813_14855 [Bacteroidota bacterium]